MVVLDVLDELRQGREVQPAAPEPAGVGEEGGGGDACHGVTSRSPRRAVPALPGPAAAGRGEAGAGGERDGARDGERARWGWGEEEEAAAAAAAETAAVAAEDGGGAAPCAGAARAARLPLSRVKALVKADPDVSLASQEAVFVLARAAELFVETIAKDAFVYAQQGKRKTLQRKDLDNAIEAVDEFAFLEGTLD